MPHWHLVVYWCTGEKRLLLQGTIHRCWPGGLRATEAFQFICGLFYILWGAFDSPWSLDANTHFKQWTSLSGTVLRRSIEGPNLSNGQGGLKLSPSASYWPNTAFWCWKSYRGEHGTIDVKESKVEVLEVSNVRPDWQQWTLEETGLFLSSLPHVAMGLSPLSGQKTTAEDPNWCHDILFKVLTMSKPQRQRQTASFPQKNLGFDTQGLPRPRICDGHHACLTKWKKNWEAKTHKILSGSMRLPLLSIPADSFLGPRAGPSSHVSSVLQRKHPNFVVKNPSYCIFWSQEKSGLGHVYPIQGSLILLDVNLWAE